MRKYLSNIFKNEDPYKSIKVWRQQKKTNKKNLIQLIQWYQWRPLRKLVRKP